MNGALVARLCSVCERPESECRFASHSGPDRRFATAEELDTERSRRLRDARDPDVALGHERAVVQAVRLRIARLAVTELSESARSNAISALDELFDAYAVERAAGKAPVSPFADTLTLEGRVA